MSRPASSDHLRFFPFDEPYEHQDEAMGEIFEALDASRDVVFEGACGTGKTLAALVPALEYVDGAEKTVVIVTNVHQQMRQFVEDARAIADTEPISAVVFQGKSSMCHIDVDYKECQALRDTTREKVETNEELQALERRESELLDAAQAGSQEAVEGRQAVMTEIAGLQDQLEQIDAERSICERYQENLTADTDAFYSWLFEDVRTAEEVYQWAHREGFCGYELLKEGMDGVDLVIANYHHLLDPFVREQFLRWLGREPEDVVAVFDEAHNIEETAREKASMSIAEATLESALTELEEVVDDRVGAARNVIEAFDEALQSIYESGLAPAEREAVGEEWVDLGIDRSEGRDELTVAFLDRYSGQGYSSDIETALSLGAALEKRYEEAFIRGETATRTECRVLQAASFIESWMEESDAPGQYPVVSVARAETGGLRGRAELYACLPSSVTAPLFESLHSTILMSATLRPFDVLTDVLGVEDPVRMAYGDPFPPERRRTYAVDVPALFARNRDDAGVVESVTTVLSDAIRMTPGNTLCFFPSYAEAERYYHRIETAGTPYLDRPGVDAEHRRQQFVADDDGVLFSSLWGTLAEGVSFDGDDARTVCVVGVPYPSLDDRLRAVQDAYAEAFGEAAPHEDPGWAYAVEIPTVRKTRQALGRVVRSPEDFGVRVLIDERYTRVHASELGEYSVHGSFPEGEREPLIDVDPGKLKFAMSNFYRDLDAWGPDQPPTP